MHIYEPAALDAWRSVATISFPSDMAQFGTSLASNGALLVIGAPGFDYHTGTVYVYQAGPPWALNASIVSPRSTGGDFGFALACDGDFILIGSTAHHAYLYAIDNGTWTLQQDLVDPYTVGNETVSPLPLPPFVLPLTLSPRSAMASAVD